MGKHLCIKKWRDKNPEKVRAHRKIFCALRSKVIKKDICFVCGFLKVEAHHEDYSKPLEVIWLCRKHHREYDTKRRSGFIHTYPLA